MKILIIPLLAAVLQAISLLVSKVGLTRRRIQIRDYIPGLFLFLAGFAALSLVKLGEVNYQVLSRPENLVMLFSIIAVAAIWNIAFYIGVKKEKANTSEGIMITMPLATIAISWLFAPSQFMLSILLTGLVATGLVVWAYSIHGKLFKFDKYAFLLGLAVVFIGLENVLVARLLSTDGISPASLYALRSLVLFVIFYFIYRPNFKRLSKKHLGFLAFSGALGTTMMLLRFYGLKDAGVVATSILLILSPALVLIIAHKFLHERVGARKIIVMVLVLGLVVMATLLNYSNIKT